MNEQYPQTETNETETSLSRQEVMIGLRKISAGLALAGGIAAFGTGIASEIVSHSETTVASSYDANGSEAVQESHDTSLISDIGEFTRSPNALTIGIGMTGIGLAMMQGSIAKRQEAELKSNQ